MVHSAEVDDVWNARLPRCLVAECCELLSCTYSCPLDLPLAICAVVLSPHLPAWLWPTRRSS